MPCGESTARTMGRSHWEHPLASGVRGGAGRRGPPAAPLPRRPRGRGAGDAPGSVRRAPQRGRRLCVVFACLVDRVFCPGRSGSRFWQEVVPPEARPSPTASAAPIGLVLGGLHPRVGFAQVDRRSAGRGSWRLASRGSWKRPWTCSPLARCCRQMCVSFTMISALCGAARTSFRMAATPAAVVRHQVAPEVSACASVLMWPLLGIAREGPSQARGSRAPLADWPFGT